MKKKFFNVGFVIQKERYMHKKILISLFTILMLSGCTELALLVSSGSFVASQNAYSKVYGGLDVITVIKTKKDIKTHAKDRLYKLRK
tara:strand:- start:23 stop:283 length:261 start_codon:yes stop_codon:yes gene_type:complete